MIKVTLLTEGEKLSLRLEGHAGYAEEGKDIVCAAASILVQTLAWYVNFGDRSKNLKSPAEIKLESGDAVVSCEPKKELAEWLENAYQFAKMGFIHLSNSYPQYVKITHDKA